MVIVKQKTGKQTFAYIRESYRYRDRNNRSRTTSRNVYCFGNLEKLKEANPDKDIDQMLQDKLRELQEEQGRTKEKMTIMLDGDKDIQKNSDHGFNVGCLYIKKAFNDIGLKRFLDDLIVKYKYKCQYSLSDIVLNLIVQQMIMPASKKREFEHLDRLFIDQDFSLDDVYRCLDLLYRHMDEINAFCYRNIKKYLDKNSRIYYYDRLNFRFTTNFDDDFRRSKKDKEGVYAPLVQMGLLIDDNGLLIGMIVFEGNANEQPSLKELETRLAKTFPLEKVIICTDAGLGSIENRYLNSTHNRSFICTQSLKGKAVRQYIKDWAKDNDNWKCTSRLLKELDIRCRPDSLEEYYQNCLKNNDFESAKKVENIILYKERWIKEDIQIQLSDTKKILKRDFEQRIIVTYSLKYLHLQMKKLNEELSKAMKVITGNMKLSSAPDRSFKRFLKILSYTSEGEIASLKTAALDNKIVEKEKEWFGYYAQCTNLEDDVSELLGVVKMRWQVEYCFRMMKTSFKARPIFLAKKEHIIGHFELIFLTLNLFKTIHYKAYLGMDHHERIGELDEDDQDRQYLTTDCLIDTLRTMSITRLETNTEVYVPHFKRTELTDCLAKVFNISLHKQAIFGKRLEKLRK